MRSLKISVNGHEFELKYSLWTGREQLFYDGRLMADKRSFAFVTPYVFTVEEVGESVVYEVNILTTLSFNIGYIIRRNGIAVAHHP